MVADLRGGVNPGRLTAMAKRLIVGITGATGAAYGVRLLEILRRQRGWESHLVLSEAAALTAWQELGMKRKDIERLADVAYSPRDVGAALASGSFLTEGMVIAPCSMKTLAAVAHAHADDLVSRAADVVLKERRRLVLLPREAPLNLAHLRNMVAVTEMGAIVAPPLTPEIRLHLATEITPIWEATEATLEAIPGYDEEARIQYAGGLSEDTGDESLAE